MNPLTKCFVTAFSLLPFTGQDANAQMIFPQTRGDWTRHPGYSNMVGNGRGLALFGIGRARSQIANRGFRGGVPIQSPPQFSSQQNPQSRIAERMRANQGGALSARTTSPQAQAETQKSQTETQKADPKIVAAFTNKFTFKPESKVSDETKNKIVEILARTYSEYSKLSPEKQTETTYREILKKEFAATGQFKEPSESALGQYFKINIKVSGEINPPKQEVPEPIVN